jgi:hypothetical protein
VREAHAIARVIESAVHDPPELERQRHR